MLIHPRKLLGVLVVAMLVLAACSSNNAEQSQGGGASGAPSGGGSVAPSASAAPMEASGDIFAMGFGYETGDTIAKTRVDEFRKQFPDVNVTFSESGFDDQQFLSALAGSDPPDVVNVPRNRIGSYIARGVLEPIDECASRAGIDPNVFYEAARNDVTVDGKMYAFPEFYNTRIWIINNKAWSDAGLDPETFDFSDWDAIKDANQKLMKVDGGKITRIGIDPKIPEFFPLWVEADGGQVISDDGMQAKLDSQEAVDSLEFTNSLVQAHGSATAFQDFRGTWDFFGKDNQVAADQIGAWPMEQWYLNVLAGNSPDVEITVKPFLTKDGDPITYEDGNSWAIVAGTDNMDAACAFTSTMVKTDTWVAAAQARAEERKANNQPNTGVYTGNQEADDIIFNQIVDLSDYPTFEKAVKTVVETQASAFGSAPSPAGAEFQQAMTDAVNRVLSGDASAADALQSANQTAQDAIDSAAP